jgi:two-component system sensor histidine kinase ChvG
VETDSVTLDPDRLLQLRAGEASGFGDDPPSPLEFSINPERIAPLLRRLVTPTRTRARVFDREGQLLLDSRALYARGDILRLDLPPIAAEDPSLMERAWNALRDLVRGGPRPASTTSARRTAALPEVQRALAAQRPPWSGNRGRRDHRSVAVPCSASGGARRAALSTQGATSMPSSRPSASPCSWTSGWRPS